MKNLFHADNNKPHHCDETSTISTQQPIPGFDISYSIRHVEESWHHLIKSDDSKKLKEIAVCNFDFLLAAVSSRDKLFSSSHQSCASTFPDADKSSLLQNDATIISFQVQTVSISYLRSLIEHVRCYILDRDIELVYYTIRKSSDVLTRDPMQLGAQVISFP